MDWHAVNVRTPAKRKMEALADHLDESQANVAEELIEEAHAEMLGGDREPAVTVSDEREEELTEHERKHREERPTFKL